MRPFALAFALLLVAPAAVALPEPVAWEARFVGSIYSMMVPCSSQDGDVLLRALYGLVDGAASFEIEYEGVGCAMGGSFAFTGSGDPFHGWRFEGYDARGGLAPMPDGGYWLEYTNLADHVDGGTGVPVRIV